ncbi:lysozyme inhibitor LprI family protein [Duganella sp. CT11-25]|jgi:uncharacterized protein YecT (DUF1311 family)|uniref:lysozyme inhibitor LprI family protein n=1 Tax=unclassified Duganella TaxID=2636909 RepID=UPI0039B0FA58
MKFSLPLLLAIWSTSSFALDCKNAVSTPDINECAAVEQKKAEDKLNKTYQDVLKSLDEGKDPETKKALIEAQRAWVKFREADCKAVYQKSIGGTIRTVMYIGCMQNRAETRIQELKDYVQTY